MPLTQVTAGNRIVTTDVNQFYNLLKGVAASGESITLIYNAAGVLIFQPSSDPAAGTQLVQIKNNAGTVKSALTSDGGAVLSARLHIAKGADIASGSTLTPGLDGNYFHVTGTTTITAIATAQAGSVVFLEFDGVCQMTYNATSLILQGAANFTSAAGDMIAFVSEGSGNWRELFRRLAAASTISLTNSSNALTGDVTMTNASTYYDGPSLTLAAGTWLLVGAIQVQITTSGGAVTAKLWDGTTTYCSAEISLQYTPAANALWRLPVQAIVTPGGSTTYKISAAGTQAGNTIKAQAVNNSPANNTGSILVAVKIA